MNTLSCKSFFCLLVVFATTGTFYSMDVLIEPVVSASEKAKILERGMPEGGLADLVESVEPESPSFKELLKQELIKLRKMEFIKIGSSRVFTMNLPGMNLKKYRLSPYDKYALLLLDDCYTIIFPDLKDSKQTVPPAAGKVVDAIWFNSYSYAIVCERAILKYSFNWKDGSFVQKGKAFSDDISIKKINSSGTRFVAEKKLGEGRSIIFCGEIAHDALDCKELEIISMCGLNEPKLSNYSLSDDGEIVVGCNGSKNVYIIEQSLDKPIKEISSKTIEAPEDIALVVCDQEGKKAAMASVDKVYIAHIHSRNIIETISVETGCISSLSFSPCSRYVLIGLEKGECVIFDLLLRLRIVVGSEVQTPVRSFELLPEWNCLCILKDNNLKLKRLDTNLEKLLDWKQVLLILKACQYSLDNVRDHPSFRKVFEEMQNKDGDEENPLAPVVTFLEEECKQCQLCMNYRADTRTACNHVFCKKCLVRAMHETPICPFCRGAIKGFLAPEGPYQVSVSLKRM